MLTPATRMAALPASFFLALNRRLAELQAQGVDIIRLDMGSPDLPPAPFIIEALQQAATQPNQHGYQPFGGPLPYRQAWVQFYARRFGVQLDPQTEVNGLLGSKQGIFQLALAYCQPGDVVLVPDPGYVTYTAGAAFAGAEAIPLPLHASQGFLPDLKALSPAVLRRTKILWLNYPNNPTGAVAPLAFFAEVVALAQQYGFLVAHDAPYTEITFEGYTAPSVLQVPGAKAVAVEFHSLSKTMNMGGWRMAVVVGNAQVLQTLSELQSHVDSGGFGPVLAGAVAALTGDQSWLVARNAVYCERRDLAVAGLRAAGLEVAAPQAAIYVWAKLPAEVSDEALAWALLNQTGVSVTPGSFFGAAGAHYLRLSLGTPTPRLQLAMERMAQWLPTYLRQAQGQGG